MTVEGEMGNDIIDLFGTSGRFRASGGDGSDVLNGSAAGDTLIVGWGSWLARVLRDDAEAGGGLQVAVIQFAIMTGAAVGGLLFDWSGWWSSFLFAAVLLLGSSLAAYAAWREQGGSR